VLRTRKERLHPHMTVVAAHNFGSRKACDLPCVALGNALGSGTIEGSRLLTLATFS
jgi:hypothetical protein